MFFLSLIFFSACKNDHQRTSEKKELIFQREIEGLDTPEKQKAFLEVIWNADQKVRADETTSLQQFGYKSIEHQEAILMMQSVDKINLKKIEWYLELYGHPSLAKHGRKACKTPWVVIHHSSSAFDARTRNFKYLYRAWQNKDIDGGQFTSYLNWFYQYENGNRLDLKSPYTEEFEIDTLLKLLDLKESH